MPITKSAAKAQRSSQRKRIHNLKTKGSYKEAVRNFKREQDPKQKKTLLPQVYSTLDKAVKKGVIHKNKAARLKSRLSVKIT